MPSHIAGARLRFELNSVWNSEAKNLLSVQTKTGVILRVPPGSSILSWVECARSTSFG